MSTLTGSKWEVLNSTVINKTTNTGAATDVHV